MRMCGSGGVCVTHEASMLILLENKRLQCCNFEATGHHMNYVIINQSLSLGDSEIRAPIWWAAPWTDHTAKISIWWNNPNPLLLVVCCKAVTATEHIQNLEEKQTNKQTKTKKKKKQIDQSPSFGDSDHQPDGPLHGQIILQKSQWWNNPSPPIDSLLQGSCSIQTHSDFFFYYLKKHLKNTRNVTIWGIIYPQWGPSYQRSVRSSCNKHNARGPEDIIAQGWGSIKFLHCFKF